MATKTNVSVEVLNRIRKDGSIDYRNYVPYATPNAEDIKKIGAVLLDNPGLMNEFYTSLVNRIGKVLIKQALFNNPLAVFNKGDVEFGSTVEEIFVNLMEAKQFNEDGDGATLYKREMADVRSAYHVINSQLMYKTTTRENMIRRAFTSIDGVETLIKGVINAMYVSANYDEFLVMKYLIARALLDGGVTTVGVSALTDEASAKGALVKFKEMSNNFEFISTDYNLTGVYNCAPKESQYLIVDNFVDSFLSVEALAYMFGVEYAQDGSKKIRVDGFDKFDMSRLKAVLGVDDDPISADELTALGNVEAVLLSEDWFQVYYNEITTKVKENEEDLYFNNWLHLWKTFSRSPFANICAFVSGTNGITSVTIDSDTIPTITNGVGGSAVMTSTVVTSGIPPKYAKAIKWEISGGTGKAKATIDETGLIKWESTLAQGNTIKVKVTSVADSSKSNEITITVA